MMILFLSGQSGAGKTTLGNNLSKEYGFRHLDGDVFYMGRDPFGEAGTFNKPEPTPEQKKAWDLVVKHFGTLFESDTTGTKPTIEDWIPALDVLSQAVADAAVKIFSAAKEDEKNKNLVVSFSVYQQEVREWLIESTRQKISSLQEQNHEVTIRYVVLHDAKGGAPKRKLAQVKEAAKAKGETMDEFYSKFGYEKYPGDDAILEQNMKVQKGFEPGAESKGEIAIELVDDGMDATAVLEQVAKRLDLKKE